MQSRRAEALGRLAVLERESAQDGWRFASMRQRFVALSERKPWRCAVVSSDNLFPTPTEIAARMVSMADVHGGMVVLEPSCGTGRILDALPEGVSAIAYDIDQRLANHCAGRFPFAECKTCDFLSIEPSPVCDRVVMNPPFRRGSDMRHIAHAYRFLRDGGLLVALCYAGSRQTQWAAQWADSVEKLPADSFKDEGTSADVLLLTKSKP
jgi:SAM-dependent methyltransferase